MARAYIATSIKAPRLLMGRKQYILMLSHARGYTSLLSHILGSHPEICGAGELFIPYRGRLDLLRLRYRAFWSIGEKSGARFFYDKVLNNELPVSDRVLNLPEVKVLFTLRKPAPTIASMIRMGLDHSDTSKYVAALGFQDPVHCCDVYIGRLRQLAEYCMALERPAIYFDGEALIDRTAEILAALREKLGLHQPLSEEYTIFDHTGKAGGDPSQLIKSGRIQRGEGHRYKVDIPESDLARAEQAYEQCRAVMRGRCICP